MISTSNSFSKVANGLQELRRDNSCEIRVLANKVLLTFREDNGIFQLQLTPADARRLAKVLRRQADVAQRNRKQLQSMEDILK